ncbi:CaiB/BaiF CoA transferase family protein [Microbacterium sp. E-13]|uniref:CaiB/BaiF CoA transferase family protein n=1 Tax=Microbacterium sp. E-13 TaxID=3404048 RepID=UPI003CF83DC4
MTGALSGIRVVDLSRVLAGPYATMLLADMGAEVLKVERPGVGDETRSWKPPTTAEGDSTYFAAVNRNKTAVTADLHDETDVAELRALIAEADVFIENARPGTVAARGLSFAELSELNPRLIYCSISGFGTHGGRDLPGFDLLVQAAGGLMSITGEPDGPPMKVGVALVDVITGLHAVTGILAALHARQSTGCGQHIEVNLLSSLLSALANQASGYVLADVEPGRLGNAHPSIAPYEVLRAADRTIALAVGTDAQFAVLAELVGAPALATDDRYRTNESRVRNREDLVVELEDRLRLEDAETWVERLMARGVPAAPVNTVAEAFAYAERLGLEPVVDVAGVRQVADPIRFSATPVDYRTAPPPIGPRVGARTSVSRARTKEGQHD